jgi:hypothetical protein
MAHASETRHAAAASAAYADNAARSTLDTAAHDITRHVCCRRCRISRLPLLFSLMRLLAAISLSPIFTSWLYATPVFFHIAADYAAFVTRRLMPLLRFHY